jgi:hypothetical protein
MKSNLVVVRALVDDVFCLALEPNQPDPAVLTLHQGRGMNWLRICTELLAMRY